MDSGNAGERGYLRVYYWVGQRKSIDMSLAFLYH